MALNAAIMRVPNTSPSTAIVNLTNQSQMYDYEAFDNNVLEFKFPG